MHHVIVVAEGLRSCHCSHSHGGSGIGDYLIFSWLWREFRWWSLLIYTGALLALGMIRAALGGGNDC